MAVNFKQNSQQMFNSNFYPTPTNVISQMCSGLDLIGKTVLEPSAGKGDIVDYLQENGAEVIACELDVSLSRIIKSKCRFLTYDFMDVTTDEISHISYVIMNPPFSSADKHILHAWKIAPEGCEIIALCNYETIGNHYSSSRGALYDIILQHGTEQNLGKVFTIAERKTEVSVGLVHLYKPRTAPETEFDGYFDFTEEEERQQNGLMPYNEIRNIVNRYVGAVKLYDQVLENAVAMQSLINDFEKYGKDLTFTCSIENKPIKRDEFKKELQKKAWKTVFGKMNMDQYITQSVRDDINRFSEQQTKVPFTMTNIFKMIDIIVGTHASRMDRVIVEAFDKICSYSDDNSEAGKGWKTNSGYKVNRRFIHPHITDYDNRWPTDTLKIHYSSGNTFDDIVKALCMLTGQRYEDQVRLTHIDSGRNTRIWGQWYEWGFFRIRGYKKGTMHFEFKDIKVWEQFNYRVAQIKGWPLPRKTDNKSKGTERSASSSQVSIFV
jgi:hypothetical protein